MAEKYSEHKEKKTDFWKGVAFLGALVIGAEILLD